MAFWAVILPAIVVLVVATGKIRKVTNRRRRLDFIRAKWSLPAEDVRNFSQIERYLNVCHEKLNLSGETAADLDIDGLFSVVDRTNSRPGQQYLYKKLRTHKLDDKDFDTQERRIEMLCSDEFTRETVELKLSELDSDDAYYLPEVFGKKHESFFSKATEFYIRIARFLLLVFAVMFAINLSQGWFLLTLIVVVANASIHFGNKKYIQAYTHSLPPLLKLIKVAEWLDERDLLAKDEATKDSLLTVRKMKKTLGAISFQNSLLEDPTDLMYMVSEWIRILFLTEPLYFILSVKKVNLYQQEIRTVFEAVGEVDAAISIQSFREGLPYYCKPGFKTAVEEMVIDELYHPLVENCVANSITCDNRNVVLITGSNMSGKTTFIRSIAINALLAQTIYTCCARQYNAPLLRVMTSINMSDDLGASKSYFQAEAMAILDIVKQSELPGLKSLVIIDEIFRGTNTIERISAAMSVLSYLTENRNFVFASTHDLEIAELMGNNTVYSFEETMEDGKLAFDYTLKPGLLKKKNGIAVLQRLGFPERIIENANAASARLRDKYKL